MAGEGVVLLVGVVHRDPRGKIKLSQLLGEEKPAFISVEISRYSRVFRARNAGTLRATLRKNLARIHEEDGLGWQDILSHGEIQGIFSFLREPYEWRAAEDYARKAGAIIKDIDLSWSSEEKLSHIPELVSLENLRSLLRLSSPKLQHHAQQQYRRAGFLFAHPPSVWPKGREEEDREIFLANELRRIIQGAGERQVVHIGGWEHLLEFPDGISFYGLLKDFHPARILLTEDIERCGPIYCRGERKTHTCIHKICEKAVENFTN